MTTGIFVNTLYLQEGFEGAFVIRVDRGHICCDLADFGGKSLSFGYCGGDEDESLGLGAVIQRRS